MNKIVLIGRLTKDPEMTMIGENKDLARARYTLAVKKMFSKNEDAVNFIKVVAFGKAGEFATKYFSKGKRVAIEGRLETSLFKDKDGNTKESYNVVAENQEFADAPFNNATKQEKEQQALDGFTTIVEDDELPFSE